VTDLDKYKDMIARAGQSFRTDPPQSPWDIEGAASYVRVGEPYTPGNGGDEVIAAFDPDGSMLGVYAVGCTYDCDGCRR
jgi:hypothetical protein